MTKDGNIQPQPRSCAFRRRWKGRKLSGSLIFFSWALLALLALELAGYVTNALISRKGDGGFSVEQQKAFDELSLKCSGVTISELRAKTPRRSEFPESGDAARLEFVAKRHEAVLICDRDGTITACYGSPSPPEIADVARLAGVGKPLDALMPGTEAGGGGRGALQRVFQTGAEYDNHFSIRLPSGDTCRFLCLFVPVKDATGAVKDARVFIRPPLWETEFVKFRKNVDILFAIGELDWGVSTVQFHTNNVGFRGKDIAVPKAAGVTRIVCIGGSTTAEGLTDDLTYPSLLQRKLRAYFASDKIEVVNCGIFNMTVAGQKQLFPEVLALQPDMMVYYNYVNDLRYSIRGWIEPHGIDLGKRAKMLLRRSRFVSRFCNALLLPSWDELGRDFDGQIDAIRALAREAKGRGIDFAVCSFAYPTARLGTRDWCFFQKSMSMWIDPLTLGSYGEVTDFYNGLVEQMCAREGIGYLPIAESLKGGSEYFTDICHLNPAGIDLKAELCFDHVKDYVAARLDK